MIYKTIKPSVHLKDFVKDYTILNFNTGNKGVSLIKPFPANVQDCMVFYLAGTVNAYDYLSGQTIRFPDISINGSQTYRFNFHLSPTFKMLSVNFRHGTLSKFLKIPLYGFTNQRLDASDVINGQIGDLREQLCSCTSINEAVVLVEHFLWKRISGLKINDQPFHKIITNEMFLNDNPSIESLAKLSYMSISQFERQFVQLNGITPKLYLRINRFNKAYEFKEKNPHCNWFTIAIDFGYNDYQHLVKDFKQFSGTVPNTLLQEQSNSPERIFCKKR